MTTFSPQGGHHDSQHVGARSHTSFEEPTRDPDVWPAPPPRDPAVWEPPTHADTRGSAASVKPVRGPRKTDARGTGPSGRNTKSSGPPSKRGAAKDKDVKKKNEGTAAGRRSVKKDDKDDKVIDLA